MGRDLFAEDPSKLHTKGRNLFATTERNQNVINNNIRDIPVDKPSTTNKQLTESFPGSSFIEPAATLVTGALAEPISGLAGIAQAINPFAEEGAGVKAIQETREALTYRPRTEEGKKGLETVSEVLSPIVETLKDAEQYLGDETFEATKSPALAAAAGTIPTALIELIGLAGSKGIVKSTSRIKAASKRTEIKKAVVEAAPEIDQLKNVSRSVYKELDDSGVKIKPESYSRMIENIKKDVSRKGFDVDITPKTAKVIKRLESESGKVLSLTEIDTLRAVAQKAADSLEKADASLGMVVINNIDDFLDSVTPSDLAKGSAKNIEIMPKYKIARDLWGRARRSELINEAFKKARNQASGFENGVVVQFRTILNNKKKSKFFKPDEIKAMQDVVRGTTASNVAKLIGRFGFSEGHATNIIGGTLGIAGGAAVGGPIGAVAVPVIGQVSRKLAQKLTRNNADLANSIVKAGKNANKIAEMYLSKTPKAGRSSAELSELLLRPDIAIETLFSSPNIFIKEAAEIARGRRVLNIFQGAGVIATPEIAKERQQIK